MCDTCVIHADESGYEGGNSVFVTQGELPADGSTRRGFLAALLTALAWAQTLAATCAIVLDSARAVARVSLPG